MKKDKRVSWILTLVFIFSIIFSGPVSPAIAGCHDISGHWAQQQIESLIAREIVTGYPDNTFKPDNPISRAEFMVMTNKVFGYTVSTPINYTDVKASDWFAADIARAQAAGYITGYEDDTMQPNKQISRQEAASIISRILSLEPADTTATLQRFLDVSGFADWSKDSIAATVEKGYLKGYPDNTFKPANNITRAEAAVVFYAVFPKQDDKIIEEPKQFDKVGTYGPEIGKQTIDQDVTISASGVILENTIITGDLTIDEAVANGDVGLNNVKVEGTAYINGGGQNSITLNQCELNKVIVNKKDGKIRIVLSENSSLKTLVADSGLKLVGRGKITDLTINSSGVEVEPKPVKKPSLRSGISARVGGVTISNSSSGGGGGGKTVTTAKVSTAAELGTALDNSNITTITLTGNITASPTVNRSLTIDFGAYTLTGDVIFRHPETGTSVLTGNAEARITGNLTVDTANASFDNGVTVDGTVNIVNVKPGTWTESADGNTLDVTDKDGATITIIGSPGSVTITQAAGGNLTLTVNPGATVNSIISNAPVNIVVASDATVTNIAAEAGADGTTITNNGTIGTLTVNASINLVANVAPTNTIVGASGSMVISGDDAGSVAPELKVFGVNGKKYADRVYAEFKLENATMSDLKSVAITLYAEDTELGTITATDKLFKDDATKDTSVQGGTIALEEGAFNYEEDSFWKFSGNYAGEGQEPTHFVVKLTSKAGVKAEVGASISDAPESVAALWDAGDTRDKIVVISDIHLGIEDSYTETLQNRPLLIEFLQRLQSTTDVRELVIAGDFLDEWFLPVYYPSYTDERQFYKDVIANNQAVIDEFNNVIGKGIKLVYVYGNHDMTLEAGVLQEAIPNIVLARDAEGLGAYYTGERNEIVIEHGHRYDVFSAPDTVTNAELCGNDDTILPAGYFYARYAATWVLEGRPTVEKKLPVVTDVPDKTDTDQYGAYIYYSLLKKISMRMTPKEGLDEKIFDMHIAGFDDAYTYLDFYPAQQEDGTISAPVLFKNIQRTWGERQNVNNVKVPNSFIEAVSGALDWEYYFRQARAQYLDNPNESVDVVVFGHTHVPRYLDMGDGKYCLNDGTWIDNNTDYPDATRTFAVITTGNKDTAALYRYAEDGTVIDIGASVSKEAD